MKREKVHFSIRKKILGLALFVTIPFVIMIVYLLFSIANYSQNYDRIVSDMTIANNYNLTFKENMDESLYKLVVGYVTFDNIGQDETLEDPYEMIDELRSEFTALKERTTSAESQVWLESLLRNIDILEKRVDDIHEASMVGDQYDKNIEELDNNIYILTDLIQEDIQYYLYYQTQDMESVNDAMSQQINTFIRVCVIIILLLAVATVMNVILIVTNILRPVDSLYEATEKVSEGDFSARARVDSQDEIAILAQGFNNMAENIQGLVDEVKEDEQKMRRMDLRLLQEQINPHFLYNTLDTIVWLIEANDTDQAVEMVVTLSDFFKLVLSKGKEAISIQEEERHIRSYLEIQSTRYRDIMEYDIQIDQVVHDYQIPKLTLQPLVENALYHGIKYKRAKGYIHIHGEKEGDLIHLTVRDNGVGMEEKELEDLRQEIERPCEETERGFGLANVNERIHMYYGYEYGMKIESEKGKGTCVEIVIPAIRELQNNI